MTDAQTGENQVAAAPAQDDPASQSQEPVADQPQAQEAVGAETETVKNEVSEIPKDNAAWAAMRTENKRLKHALDEVDPTYLQNLRSMTGPQQVVAPQVSQLGEDADYSRVTQTVNLTQQQLAQLQAQNQRLQNQLELQQDRIAEEAFPELRADKVFQQLVAEKKLVARVTGRDVTTLDLAREVKKQLERREQQVVVQTQQATKQQILDKQAAVADAKGQTTGGQSTISKEELRTRVRRGDSSAEFETSKNLIADLEF